MFLVSGLSECHISILIRTHFGVNGNVNNTITLTFAYNCVQRLASFSLASCPRSHVGCVVGKYIRLLHCIFANVSLLVLFDCGP